MTSLGVGLGRGHNGLKGEVEEVMTSWRIYRITSSCFQIIRSVLEIIIKNVKCATNLSWVTIKYVYLSWYTNRVERCLFRLFFCVKWSKTRRCLYPGVSFCIYLDGLLCRLAESKIGCFIGNVFVGALAYADDIALLAPTTRAMRLMLGICDDFAQEYAIVFNAKKTKCLWVNHSSAIKLASDRKKNLSL